ncbi:cobaltochelatase CobN [Hathewaya proteolytica DSM 3090]|uniref:Cobaltochelatase CobN n=1 Tax=Hathewaya proteolytica DSM 3090 TaxID=1121331 RepID=A0A1M6RWB7_9CLOT|nr:cobaltochelatase subunit CobN [Hathewaya proteolytica]SHK36557.1 cobaltochelatase CobN [Hathewaya proteolytica DSM 3090]
MIKILCIGLDSMLYRLRDVFRTIDNQNICIETYRLNKDKDDNVEVNNIADKAADLILIGNIAQEEHWDGIFQKLNDNLKVSIVPVGSHAINQGYYNIQPSMALEINNYITLGGMKNLTSAMSYICYHILGENFSELHKDKYKSFIFAPEMLAFNGITHGDTNDVFHSFNEYCKWYIGDGNPENYVWIGILVHRSRWESNSLHVEYELQKKLEQMGYKVILAFSYATTEEQADIKSFRGVVKDYYSYKESLIISGLVNFQMLTVSGELVEENLFQHEINNFKRINVPVFRPIISYSQTKEQWEHSVLGLVGENSWAYTTPEAVGMIEPVIIGFRDEKGQQLVMMEAVDRLASRISKWMELRVCDNKHKIVVIMIHNAPCAGVEATIGKAPGLHVFNSIIRIMNEMKKQGYYIKDIPDSGEQLQEMIMSRKAFHDFRWTSVEDIVAAKGVLYEMNGEEYGKYFNDIPENSRNKIIETWGELPGESMVYDDKIIITGLDFGNVKVMVQPKRGCYGAKCTGEVCKILHDPTCPPPHNYVATYKYIEYILKANAVVDIGTGGSLEFLPGKSVTLSNNCFPTICLGSLPHIYVYNSAVGGEGTVAKRRGNSVIIDHMPGVIENIWQNKKPNLHELGADLDEKEIVALIYQYMLNNSETMAKIRDSYEKESEFGEKITDIIMKVVNGHPCMEEIEKSYKIVKEKCANMANEINSLMAALCGQYIEAGLSGIPEENLEEVMPTGRNMHVMDSHKVPTKEAYDIGKTLAEELINKYMEENHGDMPEKIAMNMISTDISGAKGQQMSQILYLMGVRPCWNSWGKVVDIEVISLEELKRPRIDVTVRISGVLRDSFPEAVAMIDKAALIVSSLDENLTDNFIKKNTMMIKDALINAKQVDNLERRASIRVFGDKPGAYGAGVDLALKASAWKEEEDLAKVFAQFTSYAYGEDVNGKLAIKELVENIKNTDASYDVTDSRRFDTLNSCFTASVHGGFNILKKVFTGKDMCQYHGNSIKDKKPMVGALKDELKKNLEETLCNDEWKTRMKQDGYEGASDIIKSIQTLFDWQVLLKEFEHKDIDKVVDMYINDDDMRKWFEENNKYALEEIGRRFLEMHERKMWEPAPDILKALRKNYVSIEATMETSMENCSEEVQGGNIEVLNQEDIECWKNKFKEVEEFFKENK